jgi:hypothetical protein
MGDSAAGELNRRASAARGIRVLSAALGVVRRSVIFEVRSSEETNDFFLLISCDRERRE